MKRVATKSGQGRKASLPDSVAPELATLVAEAPVGAEWLHELKYDGFRILCRVDRGRASLLTRSGQDWTSRFPTVAEAAARLPIANAWLDGEVAIVMPDGRTSFQALQNGGGDEGQSLAYFVFDLLHLDGRDLRTLPLEARKRALRALTSAARSRTTPGPIRYSDHEDGDGRAFFAAACEAGLEGIVSKRRDRPHVPGRSTDWLKTKCVKRQEFVIGGFTEPKGGRAGLGALLVGVNEGGQLRYAGKVGTGFTRQSATELTRRLASLARATSPFTPPAKPTPKSVHWVSPELLAEVAFSEMTSDGKLRHPSFQGLRDDKPAKDVTRERPAKMLPKVSTKMSAKTSVKTLTKTSTKTSTKAAERSSATDVVLTHPERVLYPDVGLTKQALAAYYEAVAERMLPQLRGRPLSLVRCPAGVSGSCFYMKHAGDGAAPSLRRISIRERKASGEYLMADSPSALRALAQMSVLEIHTWNSTEAHLEAPDRMVFDLDPGPRVPWKDVVEAARTVRTRVEGLGLAAFVKSTGGKGLHVVAPLRPDADWEANLAFSRVVSEAIASEQPERYTTVMAKAGREAKILIDYLRNRRGSTSVAAFSTRARAGAPVSAPLSWDELDDFSPDRPFTVASLPKRLARETRDPWQAYERSRKSLSDVGR